MTTSRFSAVSRRAVLQGLSATAVLGLVGCSNTDAGTIASGGASTTSTPVAAPTASAAPGQFAIAFTFTADTSATADAGGGPGGDGGGRPNKGGPGGMVRNPYVAVWVEDASGALVRTISLWHLQGGQDRWLSELHRWYAASGGVDTTSSATRAPGTYDLTWDLTGADGKAIPAGTYTLCVEASREHGPYSLVTGTVQLDDKAIAITQDLAGNGELSAVAISYQP